VIGKKALITGRQAPTSQAVSQFGFLEFRLSLLRVCGQLIRVNKLFDFRKKRGVFDALNSHQTLQKNKTKSNCIFNRLLAQFKGRQPRICKKLQNTYTSQASRV